MNNLNIFYELYNEWFENDKYWFSKIEKNDKYLSDKYFKYIIDVDNIYDNYNEYDKDRKSTRLNSSHSQQSRMPSSA